MASKKETTIKNKKAPKGKNLEELIQTYINLRHDDHMNRRLYLALIRRIKPEFKG